MKELILLFSIVCAAGQLYGMEPANPYKSLLPELKREIINIALTRDNLDEAVGMIQGLSTLHNVRYDNLSDFTRLVHMLANKFNALPSIVAEGFKTLTAQKYLKLSRELYEIMLRKNNIPEAQKLIAKGADILYEPALIYFIVSDYDLSISPFEKIKFLLNHGADPNVKYHEQTALDLLNDFNEHGETVTQYKEIKSLLEAAMKK